MEKLSIFLAHKQKGAKNSLSGAEILNPKSIKCSRSNLHGQQNSGCLYKPFWGHKVSGTEIHCSENVGVVSREEHVPFGSMLTRDNEQNCRFVISSETRINRMNPKYQNFQTNSVCLQNASLDMFTSTLNHQVPKYFSWTLDPAVGMDLFLVNWNKGLLYVFPPFSLIQECLRKIIIKDQATVLLITLVWQSRPWYPLYDRPLLLPHNPQILKLP